jgi:hypothetical protein
MVVNIVRKYIKYNRKKCVKFYIEQLTEVGTNYISVGILSTDKYDSFH